MSQLYASMPRFLNSIVTAWLSSQAISALFMVVCFMLQYSIFKSNLQIPERRYFSKLHPAK
jgi:hypothetical protein